ncbi:SRPBCC domain-containing protein [Sporosarcina sp. ZBG7A]|uniref:SRPBCC family protein n=1 Tax=Sporosarcina sp. ZBG7A TaxID=1582223 RepID=UPI00057ABC9B|nr:SRPBCC domain-containing protein [Sporosarcina sp. ZBG7A]
MNVKDKLPEIRKTIILNAPIEKVWKAVSTSEGLDAWWMPNTFEAFLGKEFVLHAGPYGDSPCTVTELEPPHRLGFDWDKGWHLTFELKELDGQQTEFTLIHSGWNAEQGTVRETMNGGWESVVKVKLPAYIEG